MSEDKASGTFNRRLSVRIGSLRMRVPAPYDAWQALIVYFRSKSEEDIASIARGTGLRVPPTRGRKCTHALPGTICDNTVQSSTLTADIGWSSRSRTRQLDEYKIQRYSGLLVICTLKRCPPFVAGRPSQDREHRTKSEAPTLFPVFQARQRAESTATGARIYASAFDYLYALWQAPNDAPAGPAWAARLLDQLLVFYPQPPFHEVRRERTRLPPSAEIDPQVADGRAHIRRGTLFYAIDGTSRPQI